MSVQKKLFGEFGYLIIKIKRQFMSKIYIKERRILSKNFLPWPTNVIAV